MGINNSTIISAGTIGVTGGTASTLKKTGVEITRGTQVTDISVADFSVRPVLNFSYRPPKLINGKWSKARHEVAIIIPETIEEVNVAPLVRFIFEPHPKMNSVNRAKLLAWASQLGFDPDFADFFDRGSLD